MPLEMYGTRIQIHCQGQHRAIAVIITLNGYIVVLLPHTLPIPHGLAFLNIGK